MNSSLVTGHSSLSPRDIFHGSDGEATKLLYAELEKRGPIGTIALNLFRAQKASSRAKVYRRRFKGVAYDKKNWSLQNLCDALTKHADFQRNCSTPGCGYPDGKPCIGCGFVVSHRIMSWGWKEDPAAEYHRWVLYVDLPTGQVSFHSATRLTLRSYHNEWDGQHVSAERIIRYVDHVLTGNPPVRYIDIGAGNITDKQRDEITEHLKQTSLF